MGKLITICKLKLNSKIFEVTVFILRVLITKFTIIEYNKITQKSIANYTVEKRCYYNYNNPPAYSPEFYIPISIYG